MFLKVVYQILYSLTLMETHFLLDLEVVQLMMVAMMELMMVVKTVIQMYVYL